jgi:aspartyl-tRNA(Asn)/glutamyl-tRNA(Gln) amidotransferase subunit A
MSGPDEICRLDATELAARIRLRELSPVEVMAAHLDRIEARNPGLNALVTPNPRAEAEALLAERDVARGRRSGPLHGVPFTVKDSFDIAGLTATRGSRIFENHVPAGTATAVQRLQDAGGILLGKTNLPEFARSTETDNLVFGTTVHPLDAARTPGGSSGGEAAAVAAGLSPLGVGSDLCGSVRLPAHYCGIVGFKPTHGRIPLTGHWPQTLQRFDHVGPMARSVRDVRLALELMEGPDGQDWFAASAPPRRGGRPPVETLRIGWLGEEAFGPVADEITRAVAAAAAALTDMVGSVQRVCVPALERHDYDPLSALLNQAEGAAYFERVVAGRTADLSPRLQRSLARSGPTLPEYLAAEAAVGELHGGLLACFAEYDVLLCPVVPVTAPLLGRSELDVGGRTIRARSVLRITTPFNLAGVPAVSVPFARDRDGLPVGVQVVGRWFEDHTVLDVAELLLRRSGLPG